MKNKISTLIIALICLFATVIDTNAQTYVDPSVAVENLADESKKIYNTLETLTESDQELSTLLKEKQNIIKKLLYGLKFDQELESLVNSYLSTDPSNPSISYVFGEIDIPEGYTSIQDYYAKEILHLITK